MNDNQRLPKVLLLFAAVDWALYTRRQMVSALSRSAGRYGCTVVAVNRPLCLFTTAITKRHRWQELFKKPVLKKLEDNLYLYSPKYFIHDEIANRLPFLQKINLFALRRSYRHLQERLGISEPAPIVWYNYPHQGYVSRLFEDSFCIYELYDNLSDFEGRESEYVNRLEKKYRSRIYLLVTTSRALHNKHSHNYRDAYQFGNGLDRSIYERIMTSADVAPLDIMSITSPRIGYAGMVSDRLDWNLIGNLAAMRPDWNFIFVGPVADHKISGSLKGLPNIHFKGKVAVDEIPAALKTFDIGILPYRDNRFFHALNPLKFYEMAAAGLPMVSSNIEELKSYPENLVRVMPNNPEIWRDAISDILKSNHSDLKKIGPEIAADYIWEDLTDKLTDRLFTNLIPENQKSLRTPKT